jgi:hypothetical protein
VRRAPGTILTYADRIVLYVLVGAAVALLLNGIGRGEGTAVRIVGADGFEQVVPIGDVCEVDVPGPLGTTVIEVAGGEARVLSSPCPHQLCVKAGAVRRPGTAVVCVPNEVVVTIVGDGTDGDSDAAMDAVTR